MKYEIVKERLHDYMEHGNHDKIMAICMLINVESAAVDDFYDEGTMSMLEA